MKKHFTRVQPKIDNTAYIDPTAVIIGKVIIGKNVYVAPGAVIRSDEPKSSIVIQDNCNVQDKVIIHALAGTTVIIKKNTSLAHGCIIHGPCVIGKDCFVGFGTVIFNAELCNEVIVKHLAVIEGVEIPAGRLVANGIVVDSKDMVNDLGMASEELKAFSQKVVKANLDLAKRYKNIPSNIPR